MNGNFKVIILSAFGRQAELPGTQRIYSLLKGFHDNNFEVHLVTPDLPFITEKDLSEFNVHIIKKGVLQKLTAWILSLVQKILEKGKSASTESFKPVYKEGSRLMSYYTFFFYSKQLLPLYKTYKHTKKLCKEAIKKSQKPVVITSVAPGSYLLVGYFLKRFFKNSLIWIADYRDPIENEPMLSYSSNWFIRIANNYAFNLADGITAPEKVIIETLKSTARSRNIEISGKTHLLKLGVTPVKSSKNTKKPYTIVYGGTVYPARAVGLKKLLYSLKEIGDFKFIYAGFTPEIVAELMSEAGLEEDKCSILNLLPKPELEKLLSSSSIHLVLGTFTGNYNAPGGKIYSLLAYDKPLLVISPKTPELLEIAQNAGGVYLVDADEKEIKNALNEIAQALESKTSFRNKTFFEKYSHKEMVRQFISEFLPEALKNPPDNSQHSKA